MVRAIGYSVDDFDPADPGRLCRGRERWIESFPLNDPPLLSRSVISGAEFSDDSARDAQRGLSYSGLTAGEVVGHLFPDHPVIAWCEDGHPHHVPEGADAREDYALRGPVGSLRQWRVRWAVQCQEPGDLERAIASGADVITVLHPGSEPTQPHPEHGVLFEALRRGVFLVAGYRQEGPPDRRFQAAALPELLEACAAAVLVHQDKHDYCLGVYTTEDVDPGEALDEVVSARDVLSVPFAIPPMLARWDRALWELRQEWDAAEQGPFPVPAAPERSPAWLRRHGGRRRMGASEEE